MIYNQAALSCYARSWPANATAVEYFRDPATHGAEQEASFKAFLERPENRSLVEAHQRKEALRALKRQQRTMTSDFQQKVRRPHYVTICGSCIPT